MPKITVENAVEFKKAVEAISVLVDEADFLVSGEGLSLKATDPSQISLVSFHMPKEAFKEFSIESGQKLGLDLDYLSQVMGRAKAQDSLEMSFQPRDSKIVLTLKGGSSRKFSIPLIDVSSSEVPNPNLEFDAELKLQAEVLQDALKDAKLVSSHVMLGVEAKHFFIKASSSKGETHNITEEGKKSLLEFNAKSSCHSMFPLDYLSDMIKGASPDTEVELRLKSDAPLELSYSIGKASLSYFLAPRIETE